MGVREVIILTSEKPSRPGPGGLWSGGSERYSFRVALPQPVQPGNDYRRPALVPAKGNLCVRTRRRQRPLPSTRQRASGVGGKTQTRRTAKRPDRHGLAIRTAVRTPQRREASLSRPEEGSTPAKFH